MPETRQFLQVCALTIALAVSCVRSKPIPVEKAEQSGPVASVALTKLRSGAYQYVVRQEFEGAIREYERARVMAQSESNQKLATQFLFNIAGCYQAMFSYREAMQHYTAARDEARKHGLPQLESVALMNMAGLLLELGEAKSAGDLLKELPANGTKIPLDGRVTAFMQQASIYSELGQSAEAREAFERALKEAEGEPSKEVKAAQGKQYGKWPESIRELRRAWAFAAYSQALTRRGRFAEAEAYALEAFRIRAVYQDKSRLRECLQLAMLRRESGDRATARQLLRVAKNLDERNRWPTHLFLIDREEARIELAEGNFSKALPALKRALDRARSWRMSVLPSDSIYLNFERKLTDEVQAAFLSTILNTEFDLKQSLVAEESLWIAEEARFGSMRASQFPASEFANRLPAEYWSTLSRYQRLQLDTRTGVEKDVKSLEELERLLQRQELEAGFVVPQSARSGSPAVTAWVKSIPKDEVVFSYYLSSPNSLAWAATSQGVSVRRIAGKSQIADLVKQFRGEILSQARIGTSSTGMKLSKELFGENLVIHRTTPFWTMVVDQELASLPIGALPVNGRYLIEEHNVRLLPSVISLRRPEDSSWNQNAVGLGDPIYNSADERVQDFRGRKMNLLEISRLPESRSEVVRSLGELEKRGWKVSSQFGKEASREALKQALERDADIMHVSAHFVGVPGREEQVSIALSPSVGGGANGFFGMLDLNPVRTNTKLVVLSGCRSGDGVSLPGIGISGIARAFLISGSQSVVATLWPVRDNSGPLFAKFYEELTKHAWNSRTTSQALRAAQMEMIRSGGWSAGPSYWAAYVAISKG